MSYQVERSEPANSPESGRNGPNIALILGGVVVVLTLIFFLKNSQSTNLDSAIPRSRCSSVRSSSPSCWGC